MEPSSPFLKILPYEVARGWVEGLNGHKVSVEGTANIKLPDSRREHHVSDYLLTGIEGCGYKDQACFFIAYHDDSGWSGCSCNHGVYCADTTGSMAIAFLIPLVCYGVIGTYALLKPSASL